MVSVSRDFLLSNYCIEELGVGWYLSSAKLSKCYYFRLPDIELSDLSGFVNSKIDKFSILYDNNDLSLFVENICKYLKIKIPKLTIVTNFIKSFLSSIKSECDKTLERKTESEKLEIQRLNKVEVLEKELALKTKQLTESNEKFQTAREKQDASALKAELEILCRYIGRLGSVECPRSSYIKNIYKGFWYGIVDRYMELLKQLNVNPKSAEMERLIAQIYVTYGDFTNAYIHIKNAIQIADYTPYLTIRSFVDEYPYSLSEIILLLKECVQGCSDEMSKDLTLDSIGKLESRETKFASPEK